MAAYFIRRFLLIIPTFIGITIMVFTITRFVPGGPIERMIAQARQMQMREGTGPGGLSTEDQTQPLSGEQIEELKQYYGFDKPVLVSYFQWLGKVLRGDLGVSTRYYDPVWRMIRERMPISLYFGILSLILVYSICIPLGIAKAIKHKTYFDNFSSVTVFIGYAVPGWVVGVLMLVFFASYWEIFPLGGLTGDEFEELTLFGKLKDIIWHTILPLLAYVLGSFTVMTFAIAKGLSFRNAVFKHALRNSLIPIATSFGNNVSIILSGSFLIEKVFNINGMGLLGYESVIERDYPVVMGILVISSLLFMIGNILSDICVAIVDPRVKFE
jgi:microcin C transport system permease protein